MKKIAIFLPNLSFVGSGGAEVYGLGIAEILSEDNDVTIYTRYNPSRKFDINRIYDTYGSKYFSTKFVKMISVGYKHIAIKDILEFQLKKMICEIDDTFDLFINCTQGKLPGCKNIPSIHIVHFPDKPVNNGIFFLLRKRIDSLYIGSYTMFLANSDFTKKWFEKYWEKDCYVLNPPARVECNDECILKNKQNIIIAVDRLVPDKCILQMVSAYKQLVDKFKCDYKFIIIGNTSKKYEYYKHEIEQYISGYHIELLQNVTQKKLCELYKSAKIFWHAKGYGVDENDPYNLEHFGMTTVEAMTFGCVPIVINKAGPAEVVENGIQGRCWDTLDELCEYTWEVISSECDWSRYSIESINKAKKYQMSSFREQLLEYINTLI